MNRIDQRGVGTVPVILLLLIAALLGLAAANRQLLLELRLAGNQVRSAEAFEAAEAGLAWATALLNSPQPIGEDCRPAAAATADFRQRYLNLDATGRITPLPVAAACKRDGGGWACRCTAAALPAASASAASFRVRLVDAGRPGVVQLVADGAGPPGGTARTQVLLGLQPALARPPATAMTLRDPALPPHAFVARHLGMARATWAAQPLVQRVTCNGDCGARLLEASARGSLLSVEGDVLLRGPLALGTPQRPVLLSISGRLRIEGDVGLQGLVHAGSFEWAGPTAPWRGGLLVEGSATGTGALDLIHDPVVLERLRTGQGSFVPLPGSWRDF